MAKLYAEHGIDAEILSVCLSVRHTRYCVETLKCQ